MTRFDKILASHRSRAFAHVRRLRHLCEEAPRSGRYDVRVREITFRPDEVVSVNGSYGVSTAIVLGDDEKIETLALGDSRRLEGRAEQARQHHLREACREERLFQLECRDVQAVL